MRALSRRTANDLELLPALAGLQAEIDELIGAAVAGVIADGHSWSEVAQQLGTTKQAAHQRFGRYVAGRQGDLDDLPKILSA